MVCGTLRLYLLKWCVCVLWNNVCECARRTRGTCVVHVLVHTFTPIWIWKGTTCTTGTQVSGTCTHEACTVARVLNSSVLFPLVLSITGGRCGQGTCISVLTVVHVVHVHSGPGLFIYF